MANFTEACTQLSCVFTDASTDPNGNTTITTWSWSFGDGTPVSAATSPTHNYTAAGTYAVVLTVTDNGGLTDDFSKNVVVTAAPPPPVNVPPTASFTSACTGNTCAFTSTSTDTDGTIASYAWNFGEPASGTNTSTEANPAHTYAAVTQATDFTVTLIVTDDDGAASVAATGTVTIQPPPVGAQDCTTAGAIVACDLVLTARATVTITLTSVSCELGAQRVYIPAPIGPKQVFGNVCFRTAGEVYTLTDATGAPRVLEAGTVLPVRFEQGDPEVGDPAVEPPRGVVEGTFGTWTLRFDDGGNPISQPGFDDNVVLTVTATPQ